MADADRTETSETFWDCMAPLIGDGRLVEGTLMGGECARTPDGEFVAMPHHKGPGMVVKLPKGRVAELIDAGTGQSFAPAKRVFKEWVLIETFNEDVWRSLVNESITFVS